MTLQLNNGSSVEVGRYDLLAQPLDVIVNPANERMSHGGGVAAMIAEAGGPALIEESRAQTPVPTGQAIITSAGNLPQRAVVHTVGPRYGQADGQEARLLAEAHSNPIRLAAAHGYSSLGFPAVSCGIFGYPVAEAAPVAIGATLNTLLELESPMLVRFCLLEEVVPTFERALSVASEQLD